MSLLGKVLNKVGDVAKDVVKIGLTPIAESYNSIVNEKKIDLNFDTKVGNLVGGSVEVGTQSVHALAKTYANTITGGYADKVADIIRKDENKSSNSGIYELNNKSKVFDDSAPKILQSYETVSKKGGTVIGSVLPSILKPSTDDTTNTPKPESTPPPLGKPQSLVLKIDDSLPVKQSQSLVSSVLPGIQSPVTPVKQLQEALTKTENNMSLITSLSSASNTSTGKAAIGLLSNVVSGLITKKPSTQTLQQASNLATNSPTVNNLEGTTWKSPAQAAAFGVTITDKGASGSTGNTSTSTWKEWTPVIVVGSAIIGGIVGLVLLFKWIFGKKRK